MSAALSVARDAGGQGRRARGPTVAPEPRVRLSQGWRLGPELGRDPAEVAGDPAQVAGDGHRIGTTPLDQPSGASSSPGSAKAVPPRDAPAADIASR